MNTHCTQASAHLPLLVTVQQEGQEDYEMNNHLLPHGTDQVHYTDLRWQS